MLRFPIVVAALLALTGAASAQTKITVGKITSGSGFHIPSYVAMDQGFYKAEGLDASFITLGGRALVTAGAYRQHRLHPDPVGRRAGGAERRRDPLRGRRVAKSHWLIISRPDIAKPEDLAARRWLMAAPAPPTTTRAPP